MIKGIQAFLTGLFFVFILDFVLFLGLKLHYIDALNIDVYFNTFFADNQNPLLFFALTALIGWMSIYWKAVKAKIVLITLLFLVVSSVLIPSIGRTIGSTLFQKSDIKISIPPHLYRGDILYTDREQLYFYDTDLRRMITLPKEKE